MRASDRMRIQLAILGHGMSRTAEVLPMVLSLMALIIGGPFAVWWVIDSLWDLVRGLI